MAEKNFYNSSEFDNKKVGICFLFEVPPNTWFRYNRTFYWKINDEEAIKKNPQNDFLNDFLDISEENNGKVVAISSFDYFCMEKSMDLSDESDGNTFASPAELADDLLKRGIIPADQDGFDMKVDAPY